MLTVITGPMYSGKTSRLLAMLKANIIAGNPIEVFKPSNDFRYSTTKIATHDGVDIEAKVLDRDDPVCGFTTRMLKNRNSVLFFDEVQFFNQVGFKLLIRTLISCGRTVVCAGLANDFLGNPFGAMPYLLSAADEIVSLKAVCSKCRGIGIATRTHRTTDDKEQTVVGGTEMYEARCFKCWRFGDDDENEERV